jgi:hypothetical protein
VRRMSTPLGIMISTLLLSSAARGFCRDPQPRLCTILFSNDLAIRARVDSIRNLVEPDDPDGIAGWLYHLKVVRTYRGQAESFVDVRSENASDRVSLDVGKEYFIFASRRSDNILETGNHCCPYSGAPYSRSVEMEIESILAQTTSSIEGAVRGTDRAALKGVKIQMVGIERTIDADTDDDGRFSAVLPPGTYRISVPSEFEEDYMSFSHLSKGSISLRPGECAQLQFQRRN